MGSRKQCGHVRAHLTAQKEAVQTAANAQAYAAANAGMRGIAEALGTSLGNQIRAMDKHRLHQIRGSSDPRGSVTPVDTAVGLTVAKSLCEPERGRHRGGDASGCGKQRGGREEA